MIDFCPGADNGELIGDLGAGAEIRSTVPILLGSVGMEDVWPG